MNKTRTQLTLFLDHHYSVEIERVRKKYDPLQYRLIRSHVTLCREDKIEDLARIKLNLRLLNLGSIVIDFDQLIRFAHQKGVMMVLEFENQQFHDLRQVILNGSDLPISFPDPHITLIHPRNFSCTDEIFDEIRKINTLKSITFKEISLIQQTNNSEWKILERFKI